MKNFILKFFDYSLSRIIILIDLIFRKLFNWNYFLPRLHDRIQTKQYYSKIINNINVFFFCPSATTLNRVESFFTKEPETLNWINNFEEDKRKKIVFWDIGANIGIYSIYAATKFKDIEIISFEPSTSNTRTLSRNISINNLYDKIKIFPIALCDKENIISFFNETKFAEGGASSVYNDTKDEFGNLLNEKKIKNKYNIFGTSIDFLIMENILVCPNYIKMDVDGIEHLILNGAKNLLSNKNLQELSIEMNPNYYQQYDNINKIMIDYGFERVIETNARLLNNINYKLKFNETVNVIFKRMNK